MFDFLVPIIFGWPALIASLLLSAAGLAQRKPWMVALGGVLAAPFCWYLSGYPALGAPVALLPFLQFVSAWVLQRGNRPLAWGLLAPLTATGVFVAVAVLSQPVAF